MPTLQEKIVKVFLEKLSTEGPVDAHNIERLRALLTSDKKPKVDDLVKAFSPPPEEDVN